ncbi:MAG: hypothetical protein RLZZ507_900 [Cyanobacteriota bacterium]|jgi:Uma2 family endonuclease
MNRTESHYVSIQPTLRRLSSSVISLQPITNPVMITEVLSNSSKSYDQDEKFAAYRTITTFQEYILIYQDSMHVEQYCKIGDNKSIICQISLGDIYDKVDFNVEE